jgi:hypothetical protein
LYKLFPVGFVFMAFCLGYIAKIIRRRQHDKSSKILRNLPSPAIHSVGSDIPQKVFTLIGILCLFYSIYQFHVYP